MDSLKGKAKGHFILMVTFSFGIDVERARERQRSTFVNAARLSVKVQKPVKEPL